MQLRTQNLVDIASKNVVKTFIELKFVASRIRFFFFCQEVLLAHFVPEVTYRPQCCVI